VQPAEVRLGDARAQSLRALNCARLLGVGKDDAKLIAPIARNDIARIRALPCVGVAQASAKAHRR
jgi:hypothetical protein